MNKLEITIEGLRMKFKVSACDFEDYRQKTYLILGNKAHRNDATFANTVITNAMICIYKREKSKNNVMKLFVAFFVFIS